MRGFTKAIVLFALFAVAASRSHFEHFRSEGHSIMKRMAEADEIFEEHDVATVHLVEGQERRTKRMARKDLRLLSKNQIRNRLQLALSSGSKLNLALKPAEVGHSETMVSYHTDTGYRKEKKMATDCYFHGQMEDSTGTGWAAISQCNGVFGFASSQSYEYFLHPVEARRSKRDANEEFDVHVLWRRAASNNFDKAAPPPGRDEDGFEDEDEIPNDDEEEGDMMAAYDEGFDNTTSFVIELAMFSDEKFCKRLENSYPGREDEFLLTRLAGTQAMYGDLEKVGYDVKIKLKLLEYWKTDPANYTFSEEFPRNLRSSCQYTTKLYNYDIHALNTGIGKWNGGQIGLAFVSGACTNKRCFVVKGVDFKTFVGFGHEVGHTLGLSHRNTINCPPEIGSKGGFMGGGSSLLFAPCMKYRLQRLFDSGKDKCLFRESSESNTPIEYQSVPSLFPGQSRSPDRICNILAGTGYKYVVNERPFGSGLCLWFVCLNEDKDSPEFLRAKRFFAPIGFPCRAEASCQKDQSCRMWNVTKMTLEPETLQNMAKIPEWTEWSTELSPCSRSCGTGVRVRRRECQYVDYDLALYCPGLSVKPELCNTHPCEGEPTTRVGLRHLRRNEVCERFFNHSVRLRLKKADAYLPKGSSLEPSDTGANIPVGHSRSCLLKCVREPESATADLDAILPDGTLCLENRRPKYDLGRLNIQMRCLRGHCHEFSDCPDGRHIKDDCGICDGDGSRCFSLTLNPLDFIRKKHRAVLTVIPSCATNIDVYFDRSRGWGLILELWSHDDEQIIGEGGQYPVAKYEGSETVEYAGTSWTYQPYETSLRAPGPLNQTVKIQALRTRHDVKKVTIHYARCL